MTVLIDREPESSLDETSFRTMNSKDGDRAAMEADIAAYLARGGQITVLPPCVSSDALRDAAKRSFSITTEETKAKRVRPKK
jgi:hypothetical protein